MSPDERKKTTSRTIMIGGKAFATYTNAKRIVKLVNDVGAVVNNDPEVNSYLKVILFEFAFHMVIMPSLLIRMVKTYRLRIPILSIM